MARSSKHFAVLLSSLVGVSLAGCGSTARSGFGDTSDPTNPTAPGSNGTLGDPTTTGPQSTDGSCAKVETEAKRPPIDVIMIIDQSGSMSDEIANVKANINKLSDFLGNTGLDYRLVMIGKAGTGAYDICVPPPLGGSDCSAANGDRYHIVPREIDSWDSLTVLLQELRTPNGMSAYLRSDAVKVIVPVSDDNSNPFQGGILAQDFDNQMLTIPGFGSSGGRNYHLFPIIGAKYNPGDELKPGTTTPDYCSTAQNAGAEYVKIAKITKSRWWQICDADFGPVLQDIGNSIASQVACELPVPKPGSGVELDPTKVNVKVLPGNGGASSTILQDKSAPCDGGANGWQYNADQSKILLCGAACTGVRAQANTKVNVQFGCTTQVK